MLNEKNSGEPTVKLVVDPEAGTVRVKELYPVAKDVNAGDLQFYRHYIASFRHFGEGACSLTKTKKLYETWNDEALDVRRMLPSGGMGDESKAQVYEKLVSKGDEAMAQAYERLVSKKLSLGTFPFELWTIEDEAELASIENAIIARLGYRAQCIELGLTKRLSAKELDKYRNLSWDKYSCTVEGGLTDDDEKKHRSLTRKILNPSERRIERVATKRNAKEEERLIMFSRVRLKNDGCMKVGSAGKIGTGGISYPWCNSFQYRILPDTEGIGDPFVHCIDRKDIEMMCSLCDSVASKKGCCVGCKYAWYCSKECQRKHWKVHKKLCKKNKPELSKKVVQKLKGDGTQHQDLLLMYIAASKMDSTTNDVEAFQCKWKQLIDSVE